MVRVCYFFFSQLGTNKSCPGREKKSTEKMPLSDWPGVKSHSSRTLPSGKVFLGCTKRQIGCSLSL